jgi:hypothetical protein
LLKLGSLAGRVIVIILSDRNVAAVSYGIRIMKYVSGYVSCLCYLAITGCASIVSDSKYPVSVVTEPSAARVEIKDQNGVLRYVGTSPATAVLDAGSGFFTRARYTVTASKDGYMSASLPLANSIDGWYWGNLLIGGLIGFLIVDPITGAMFEIDSPVANMSLTPAVASASVDIERLQKLKELRELGVLTEVEYQSKRRSLVGNL